jgi:hypothetical protein
MKDTGPGGIGPRTRAARHKADNKRDVGEKQDATHEQPCTGRTGVGTISRVLGACSKMIGRDVTAPADAFGPVYPPLYQVSTVPNAMPWNCASRVAPLRPGAP